MDCFRHIIVNTIYECDDDDDDDDDNNNNNKYVGLKVCTIKRFGISQLFQSI